ncbi:hypothetical protein BJX99DRAFT_226658 [Aspergillus californicus]
MFDQESLFETLRQPIAIIMSLRRKSCDACFKGRRKCNLAYPTCETCRKSKKRCRYAYPPSPPGSDQSPTPPNTNTNSLERLFDSIDESSLGFEYLNPESTSDLFAQYPPRRSTTSVSPAIAPASLTITRLVGELGQVQPIEGSTRSWKWVIDELKSYPRQFARTAQTIFIHRDLYHDEIPQSMRTAFGVLSALTLNPETNHAMLFRVIDAEVLDLLHPIEPRSSTPMDDLARLQALLFYQTIRLFHGNLTQRIMAEQQQATLMSLALKLVVRSQTELHETTRQSWILTECIRRTAIIVYFLYGVNSIHREGICIGIHTLAKLPLSTKLSAWTMEDHAHPAGTGETIPYETFLSRWLVSLPRRLDPFEKLLIVPCQGLDAAEAYDSLGLLCVD